MRNFEYFLFENFDAEKEADNPKQPRNLLKMPGKDAVLSEIARFPAFSCSYHRVCDQVGEKQVQLLIEMGVIRKSGTSLLFDCPVFLREDANVLQHEIASRANRLVCLLERSMPEIRACCMNIRNGFTVEENLYHILCGMVFDGMLFDCLCEKGVLSISREHPSGLDYLNVIYEQCAELETLSNRLLCSYNRLSNTGCALQSFGDAHGNRFDFYRFFRLMEQGKADGIFKKAEKLLRTTCSEMSGERLLKETEALIRTGTCHPDAMKMLEMFAYAKNGTICVPVFLQEHRDAIHCMERLVEKSMGNAIAEVLIEMASSVTITAVRHGVNRLEIANELYHIVFGSINEILVQRKAVAAPKAFPGEGRYLKCIEVFV